MLIFADEAARRACVEALQQAPLPPGYVIHTIILPTGCTPEQMDVYVKAHPYVYFFIAVAFELDFVCPDVLNAENVGKLEYFMGYSFTPAQRHALRHHVFYDFAQHADAPMLI